jgi:hypothetical protein
MNVKAAEKVESFFSPDLLTDAGMPYETRRTLLLEASRNFLQHHQEIIKERHRAGASGRQTSPKKASEPVP